MSTPMSPEKSESSSKSRSSRKERKIWNKPIETSKFPSFKFSDFTTDQIPTIFSGYTAESEDSSSSELSDDSRTHSLSSDDNDEDIDQGRSESIKKSVSRVSSMKVLMRQSTRKGQRLKKMRSMKRLTSSSRNLLRKKKKNLDGLGLLEPHYLKPTSSSASKNVENIQKSSLGVARLKRIASLRYNGLLKATCSSAMKGSKKSNDVCNYRYCSLHGVRHSHAADNGGVTVPSLKRFVSMRRKFLKRQKSVNRRLVLLKRSLSRKRGPFVIDQDSKNDDDDDADGESNQNGSSSENGGNDSEPKERSSHILMVEAEDRGMESKPEKDVGICEQIATVLDHDDGMIDGTKSEETVEDVKEEVLREGSSGEVHIEETENVWDDNEKVKGTKSEEGIIEDREEVGREEDEKKNTEDAWNETVALVKQAFDEILAEITEDDDSDVAIIKNEGFSKEDDDGADSSSSDTKPVKEKDTYLSVIVSTSHTGEEEPARPKKWSYLKRVILLKRFLKSLDRRKFSDGEESETMRLRRELIGEKKNAEEWMLDHALRQVVSTLDPSQKRKVKHLVRAFESLIPLNGRRGSKSIDGLESPGREKNETLNSTMTLRDGKETTDLLEVSPRKDVEETKSTSEADANSSQNLAVEEELNRLASSSSLGKEENERLNSPTILRDVEDTTDLLEVSPTKDLEETELTSEALESEADASLSQYLLVEEDLDGLASSSSPGIEEKETFNSPTILRDNDKDTTDQAEVSPRKDLEVTSKAFESEEEELDGLASSSNLGREENETLNSPTILRNDKDTTDPLEGDLEETSEASSSLSISLKSYKDSEPKTEATSSQHVAVEEASFEKEEKAGDSENQNLSTWRNIIQKHMVMSDNSEENRDETEKDEDGVDSEAVKSFQDAFETILSEIPDPTFDDKEIVSEPSKSVKDQEETKKKSWNSLRKVILLKRFVKSLDNVRVFNPRKPRYLPVESELEAETVLLRHRATMERGKHGEEMMLDYALRQAISRLAPIQRQKVELLVQAFDTVLDGHEAPNKTKNRDETDGEGTPKVEEDSKVNKDKQRIENVFSRLIHRKDLKGEEEVDSTPKESLRNLLPPTTPVRNAKQRIVVEKEKDSRLWKLIYKHMAPEKEETDSTISEGSECDDLQIDARSNTVTLVREALEKILSEIPDNSSDDQSMESDITTDQELFERNSQVSEELTTFKPKRVKGWNNVKKVILLKRFVSDLGSMTKTPRFLPWEPDQETEKINLRHQEVGGKKNSEEWMIDYALRQAISTLPPSQRRKVSLLAQAFDTISLQDIGSTTTSRNISRQSSLSSTTGNNENDGNAEILRGKLINLQESLKDNTKHDGVGNDMEEKQQCSSLWRFLCKQMEDNERHQTSPEETRKEEEGEESKEDTNVDGEKMELYQTEAVELLGEVIDGISLEENQEQNIMTRTETVPVMMRTSNNRWSNVKRVIQLRRFVKALENVRRFNPKERRLLPSNVSIEAEKVNLRHQETQNKRNNDEWMVDNALQGVVSKLTPARKVKVQLLVQAFESLSASGN